MARILIIDDETIWLALLEDIVKEMGYEVCSAASFTEAQELLARLQFDLVLVDIGLDNELGFAVSRMLLDLLFQRLPQVPVIAITPLSIEPEQLIRWRDFSEEHRIIYTVSKRHFDLNELTESINKALSVPLESDQVDTLRVDAAVPKQVYLNSTFVLEVAIRQRSSPVPKEDGLEQVRSGDVQVSWPETEPSISLYVQVSAPDCKIREPSRQPFRLYAGHESPVIYFHLTPKKLGEISIIVRVFQKKYCLGSARVHTVVQEQIVGSVKMVVPSHRLNGSLRQILVLRFSLEELRTLCTDLDVSFDVLRGEGQEAKARELIAHLQRRERLGELVSYIRQHRPDIKLA